MRRAARTDENQAAIVDAFRRCGARVWQCAECGAEKPWSAHQARQVYCSRACVSKAYSRRMQGEANPNYSDASARECEHCGQRYESYNKSRRFCSLMCRDLSKRKRAEVKCAGCGADFYPRSSAQKSCSAQCSRLARTRPARVPVRIYRPRGDPLMQACGQCGAEFRVYPSRPRKYCSYSCHIESGGARRAGEAAIMAKKKYGAKKDANHSEIMAAIAEIAPVIDTSNLGFGFPDGIACVKEQAELFDIKNPETGYGRRGLNDKQSEFARNWPRGVYLIYTKEQAQQFARGEFSGLHWVGPEIVESVDDVLRIMGARG